MKIKEPKYRYSNVMLIDDSELDNFINQKTLEANHFAKKVYLATGAKSALEFLQNLLTIGDQFGNAFPDVIFIDINMPMMDGFQFIEQFRRFSDKMNNPKLVILTSSVYEHDRENAASLPGNVLFLNKPLTKEMLDRI
jgi:CheY-like chemotaxis protein